MRSATNFNFTSHTHSFVHFDLHKYRNRIYDNNYSTQATAIHNSRIHIVAVLTVLLVVAEAADHLIVRVTVQS